MLRTTSAEWTPCPIASGLDCRQSVGKHHGEDVDHLPIAVVGAGQLAPHALHGGWQHAVLEGRAITQGAGLAGEHRHVVPRIVDGLAARVFADDPAVLADDDTLRIGLECRA
jgi:hypothetical protein